MDITGTLFSYYFLCHRKMWLSHNRICYEHDSEAVAMGKFIDENTFQREKHNIIVDGLINIDYIKNQLVYEIKKSDKCEEMSINQLKYYLYLLRNKGIEMNGVILYPLLKKSREISLNEADVKNIEENLKIIESILSKEIPPKIIKQSACRNCAYFDFCFSD